jgi:hypothetical protein
MAGVCTHVGGLNMTGRHARNSAVGVGVAIGVMIAVALDNYLLGVSFGILAAAGVWTASK